MYLTWSLLVNQGRKLKKRESTRLGTTRVPRRPQNTDFLLGKLARQCCRRLHSSKRQWVGLSNIVVQSPLDTDPLIGFEKLVQSTSFVLYMYAATATGHCIHFPHGLPSG